MKKLKILSRKKKLKRWSIIWIGKILLIYMMKMNWLMLKKIQCTKNWMKHFQLKLDKRSVSLFKDLKVKEIFQGA